MGKSSTAQIHLMNKDRGGKLTLTLDANSRFKAYYQEIISSRGLVFKSLPLIATRKLYLDPGCSASINHEISSVRGDFWVDATVPDESVAADTPLLIMPDKGHLIEDGLLIEVKPYTGGPVTTSIFNISNEQKKIREGEVYSILYWMPRTLMEWEIR